MAKVVFEADDNRKGIVDKIFVNNNQKIDRGTKIANIITQNKVYEIKASEPGEIKNINVYENKIINSGDILMEIDGNLLENNTPKYGPEQIYNNASTKYNKIGQTLGEAKKSETEIFREELIETLLARKVVGEDNVEQDLESTVEISNSELLNNKVDEASKDIFKDDVSTTSYILEDKIESKNNHLANAENLEILQNDLADLKQNLSDIDNDTNTEELQKEIINQITDLESEIKMTSEMETAFGNEKPLSNTLIHRMYSDIQEELNNESNEEELILDDETNSETIYFNEELSTDDLVDDLLTMPEYEQSEEVVANNNEILASTNILARNNENSSKSQIQENFNNSSQVDEVVLTGQAIKKANEIIMRKKNNVHSFIDVEVDVSELVNLLSIMRDAYSQNDIELTLLPFYIKAVHDGLKKFPLLNATFKTDTNSILLKWFYNIAFSVDIDSGVKMPVLYDLKNESIKEIASKVTKIIAKTVNNELTEKEYQNGSFAILNYGEYGITRGTLTISENNVAGIAMGIIFKKPVVVEKNDITIRDIMVITLGYNEAVIEITEASKFVHYVAYLLSNPGLLL